MKKYKVGWHTTRLERFAYMLYFTGQVIFYTMVTSFALTYLINAGINAILAGSILLLPKIWDAINDTLFGVIVDKARFQKGRFLPWIRIASILMPIATIFFFSMPSGLTETAKCIWVIIGYVLWDTCYTMCDAPIYALSTSMTTNMDERTSILSYTRISGGIGGMFAAVIIPLLYGANGANFGWMKTAILLSVIGAICMIPIGFVGRERFHGEKNKEITFKELWTGLIQNKNLLVIVLVRFIFFLTFTVEVLNAIFAQYVIGNETFGSTMSLAISLPILILAAFIPTLCRRIDKVHLLAVFMGIFVVGSILQYLVGYENTTFVLLLTAFRCLGYGGFSTLIFMFIPDCIEYGQYTTGNRNEGIAFSLQTFAGKLNGALIATIAAYLISALGFKAEQVTAAGKNGVWFALTVFAAIGSVIAIPLLLKFYKLRDKKVAVMIACNNGEISKEESIQRLGGE